MGSEQNPPGSHEAANASEIGIEVKKQVVPLAEALITSKAHEASGGKKDTEELQLLAGYKMITDHVSKYSSESVDTGRHRDGFPLKDPESQIHVGIKIGAGDTKQEIQGRVTAIGQSYPKDGVVLVQITDDKGNICKIPNNKGEMTDQIPISTKQLYDGQLQLILDTTNCPFSSQEQQVLRAAIALGNGESVASNAIPTLDEMKELLEKSPMLTKDKALKKARQIVEKLPKYPGTKPEPGISGSPTEPERTKLAQWIGENQRWEDLGKAEHDRITELQTLAQELADSEGTLASPEKFGRLLALGHEPTVRAGMAQLKANISLREQSMRESLSVGDQATAKRMQEKLSELRDEQKLKEETLQNFESNVVDLIKKVNAGEITRAITNKDGAINPDPTELMNDFINKESADVIEDLKKIDGAMMLKKTEALLKDNKNEAIKTFFEKYKPYILAGGAFALIAFKVIEYALQKSEKA
ncbi:MAG: hypothetical protein ACOYK6_08870 [Chthoniobacterales bacterium]